MSAVTPSEDGKALAFLSSAIMVPAEISAVEGREPVKVTNLPLPAFNKIPKPQVKRFTYQRERRRNGLCAYDSPANFDPLKALQLSCRVSMQVRARKDSAVIRC